MNLNELVRAVHEQAIRSGWWEKDLIRTPLEIHMLCVSEIAEATESVRKGELPEFMDDKCKPQGEAVELADCVIRICDYFGYKDWDLEDVIARKLTYNKSREYRHGKKL